MSANQQKHLNSLGFAVGGKQSRALIAWGYDANGMRISIRDAKRGGSQGLRCDCKTPLVAKKGDIREHHFAHKAGDVRHCETAAAAAMVNFISNTLLDAGHVALPVTAGILSRAEVLAVSTVIVAGHTLHVIDAQQDRRLAIFTRVRRQNVETLEDWCRRNDVSGMVIDLSRFRNKADDEIRWAIERSAPRKWLFRSSHNDHQASPRFLRRLFGLQR